MEKSDRKQATARRERGRRKPIPTHLLPPAILFGFLLLLPLNVLAQGSADTIQVGIMAPDGKAIPIGIALKKTEKLPDGSLLAQDADPSTLIALSNQGWQWRDLLSTVDTMASKVAVPAGMGWVGKKSWDLYKFSNVSTEADVLKALVSRGMHPESASTRANEIYAILKSGNAKVALVAIAAGGATAVGLKATNPDMPLGYILLVTVGVMIVVGGVYYLLQRKKIVV